MKREDFGLEVCLPRYSSPLEKGVMVEGFLAVGRLSEILADITDFQRGLKGKMEEGGSRIGKREVLKVSSFDVRLREWKRVFRLASRRAGIEEGRRSFNLRNVIAEYVFSFPPPPPPLPPSFLPYKLQYLVSKRIKY